VSPSDEIFAHHSLLLIFLVLTLVLMQASPDKHALTTPVLRRLPVRAFPAAFGPSA
jgi:hypothetical protein